MKKIRLSVIIGFSLTLICTLVFNIVSFARQCNELRDDVFRLHIIANSDSVYDQALKLNVRDFVLTETKVSLADTATKEEAIKYLSDNCDEIEAEVNEFLDENGCDYTATACISRSFFETRVYDENTLPAGVYDALKITLGEGEGKNWWCVMFPPLCIGAADDDNEKSSLSEEETELMESGDKPEYIIKFKIVEWYQKIKNRLKNN